MCGPQSSGMRPTDVTGRGMRWARANWRTIATRLSPPRPPRAASPRPELTDQGDNAGGEPPAGKPPKRRRRLWRMVTSIIGAVIVVLIIAAFVAAHFTSASSFCNSCHEMNPYYASWQASTHKTAQCRDCHIPPGFIPYIETKLGSLREIYVHLTGNPKAPLAVTRKIPNASCFRCHPNPPPDPALPTVTFTHAKKHSGLNCISCHIRLVHRTVNPPGLRESGADVILPHVPQRKHRPEQLLLLPHAAA